VKTFEQFQQIFSIASLNVEFQQFLKTTMSSSMVEMILPSETFINILEYFSWFSFLISTMLFLLMYWVVIKNSPKEMKVYRWYILFNFNMLFLPELLVGIFHPKLMGPYLAFVIG